MNPSDYPLALWPPAASASAVQTDWIILAFTLLTLLLTAPIFLGITWFAAYYRAGRQVNRVHDETRSNALELSWMIIPFVLTLFFFGWAARLYDVHRHAPPDAMTVTAVGRQWMWKFQHPGGQAEINTLHVPVGEPVRIRMISQDVIHGLYIPALRIQMETLPDRYTEMWFKADRTGTYRLYCSEYCGTDHSAMDGLLTIMEPAAYQAWLQGSGASISLASEGSRLFAAYGCGGCHDGRSTVRAPSLAGLFGRPVPLEGGGTVLADDGYLRNKILMPDQHLIAGYQQVMPSFKGIIPEDDLVRLIAYIKTGTASPEPGQEQAR